MTLELGIALARLIIGLGIAAHGAQKLFGLFGGGGPEGTGQYMDSLGLRPGRFYGLTAGTCELVGGLLLAFGLFGAVGPALIIVVMTTASLTQHRGHGFFNTDGGFELPVVYAMCAVVFACIGHGAYSVDALFDTGALVLPSVTWSLLAIGLLLGLIIGVIPRFRSEEPAPA